MTGLRALPFIRRMAQSGRAPHLDVSSVDEQMARFAAARIGAAHDPLTSWFPYLGQGSARCLRYQSTRAIRTGLAGPAVGPDTAWRWSPYLPRWLWPAAVYAPARALGLNRAAGTHYVAFRCTGVPPRQIPGRRRRLSELVRGLPNRRRSVLLDQRLAALLTGSWQ